MQLTDRIVKSQHNVLCPLHYGYYAQDCVVLGTDFANGLVSSLMS